MNAATREALARLKAWLLDCAYPIWWERGADLARGGYHDRLGLDGAPVPGGKRMRVQARQAHVYALASQLGWAGPAEAACRHGLDFILAHGRRPDGLYWSNFSEAGAPAGDAAELYDQAFVLLALASAFGAFGGAEREAVAAALRARLAACSHPLGGFAETTGAAEPLMSNPNMHLFEAFQAWAEVSADRAWSELAQSQARLALSRFIDPKTGALSEVFDAAWRPPAPDAMQIWPGHMFEWAWLLMRWDGADAASNAAALRLVEVAERVGVERGAAIFELDGRLEPRDRRARLWAQTERIKATSLAAQLTSDERLWDAAAEACATLEGFLEAPTPGLWRDWLDEAGAFREEPAPASSFYHIVGAIAELERLAG